MNSAKLPRAEEAIVEASKIADYLLNVAHPDGGAKAAFFMRFGFNPGRPVELLQALQRHALMHQVSTMVENPHGRRYTVDGAVETPDGRNPLLRTVWITERADAPPRLITAYPLPARP